jgi:hypothetical protein
MIAAQRTRRIAQLAQILRNAKNALLRMTSNAGSLDSARDRHSAAEKTLAWDSVET